jgi:hypothetical protein
MAYGSRGLSDLNNRRGRRADEGQGARGNLPQLGEGGGSACSPLHPVLKWHLADATTLTLMKITPDEFNNHNKIKNRYGYPSLHPS